MNVNNYTKNGAIKVMIGNTTSSQLLEYLVNMKLLLGCKSSFFPMQLTKGSSNESQESKLFLMENMEKVIDS